MDDELKFVIGSREDYLWSKNIIEKYDLAKKTTILFSVVLVNCFQLNWLIGFWKIN